jgi:hypothetical protein
MMKVYVTTEHDTHYPVGGASIAIASDEKAARKVLDELLMSDGLKPSSQHPYTFIVIDITNIHKPTAMILNSGDY